MNDMWYNLTAINGNGGVLGIIQSVNDNFMQHLYGTLILVVLFVIIFRATYTYNGNPKVSFMYASFFLTFLAILFKLLDLCYDATVFIFISLFLLSVGLQFLVDP
jgi:hypothetical protein